MRTNKAVASFDVFYKETLAQKISKAAYNISEIIS
jgi:hypothetical protein